LPVTPEAVMVCRPIGLLEMEDEHGVDTKILCVPISEVDPFFTHINDVNDLDLATLDRIRLFFKQYKDMEKEKWSKVENFSDKATAIRVINETIAAAKK
jgi:inorganic pyrophosphatase